MPTYEYECQACGERMEAFQSITEGPLRKCPSCGALKLRRLIGAGSALIFKGSGFYITDYRSESYNKGKASESGSKSDSKAGSGDKGGKSSAGGDKSGGKSSDSS